MSSVVLTNVELECQEHLIFIYLPEMEFVLLFPVSKIRYQNCI